MEHPRNTPHLRHLTSWSSLRCSLMMIMIRVYFTMYVSFLVIGYIWYNSKHFKNGIASKAPLDPSLPTPTTLDRTITAASGQDIDCIVKITYCKLSKYCMVIFVSSPLQAFSQWYLGIPWVQTRIGVKSLFLGFLVVLMQHVYLPECWPWYVRHHSYSGLSSNEQVGGLASASQFWSGWFDLPCLQTREWGMYILFLWGHCSS